MSRHYYIMKKLKLIPKYIMEDKNARIFVRTSVTADYDFQYAKIKEIEFDILKTMFSDMVILLNPSDELRTFLKVLGLEVNEVKNNGFPLELLLDADYDVRFKHDLGE